MRPPADRGSTIPLIVGFTSMLLVAGAVVVDATAAYVQRQSLDTLADGAALRGADLGAQGLEVYAGGLGAGRLDLTEQAARAAVAAYLTDTGAYRRVPGLHLPGGRGGGGGGGPPRGPPPPPRRR